MRRSILLLLVYLVWMPMVAAFTLVVLLTSYLFIATMANPLPVVLAQVMKIVFIAVWPIGVLYAAWQLGHGLTVPWPLRPLTALSLVLPATILLLHLLTFINACYSGEAFPLKTAHC